MRNLRTLFFGTFIALRNHEPLLGKKENPFCRRPAALLCQEQQAYRPQTGLILPSAAGFSSKGGSKALRRGVWSRNASNCKRGTGQSFFCPVLPDLFGHFLHGDSPYLGSIFPAPSIRAGGPPWAGRNGVPPAHRPVSISYFSTSINTAPPASKLMASASWRV